MLPPRTCKNAALLLCTLSSGLALGSPADARPADGSTETPDIGSVAPDLTVPPLSKGKPTAGKRVTQVHPEWKGTSVHHVVYLPTDWNAARTFPVLVELAGNGPYRSRFGDISTGEVEDSRFGYGISGGKRFIWLCLPYLDGAGKANVTRWWGTAPRYDPGPTVRYVKKTVPWICEKYGGDTERVVLIGFSRGAIACNFIGLHDDEIADLWRAFVPFSHYDGVVQTWGYPGAERTAARERLRRLGQRPQFILHEMTSDRRVALATTRAYLEACHVEAPLRFRSTGFRNHSDAWTLRPSRARLELREWLSEVTAPARGSSCVSGCRR